MPAQFAPKARLILIPVFLIAVICMFCSFSSLTKAVHENKMFNSALQGTWQKTYVRFNDKFTMIHDWPYPAGGPMTVLTDYSYQVGDTQCTGHRFEFGQDNPHQIALPANDKRLHEIIRFFCPRAPGKEEIGKKMIYKYPCYPIGASYNPDNVCESYIALPSNTDQVSAKLKRAIGFPALSILLEIVVAAGCLWGLWPLLKTLRK